MPDGDQVQGQVDAAGDPGGGDDPAVDHVEHVADDGRPRVAPGQLVLHVVVGGAAAAVEQAGPAEGVGPGADAGDRAAVRVVGGERLSVAPASGPVARDPGPCDRQPGTMIRSSGVERGPLRWRPEGDALRGGDVFLLGDVGQLVAAAEVGGGGEHLGGPGEVEQVQPGDEQEDDRSRSGQDS